MLNLKKWDWFAGILIVIGAFLRLYRLREFVTFLGDQGRDAIIIKRIVTLEHFPAIGPPSSLGGIYLGPFYYYLVAPFLVLFRMDPLGLAVGVSILSIIGVALSYFLIQKTVNKKTAIIVLSLYVFSATNIALARFSWNPNLLPLFSFLALYFFHKTFTESKKVSFLNAVLFGIFFSFSVQLHYLAGIMIFTFLFALLWISIEKKPLPFWQSIIKILLSVCSFATATAPLIIFDLRHNFLNSRNFLNLFLQKDVVAHSSLLDRFGDTSGSFFTHVFLFQWSGLAAIIFLFCLVGAYLFFKKNTFVTINAINLVAFFVGFSFLNSARHPHYYGVVYISFFVLAAYVLSMCVTKKIGFFAICIVVAIYVFLNAQQYYFLFQHGSYQIERAKTISASIYDHITNVPYQLASIPDTETDGHIRYFLEIMGKRPLLEDSRQEPAELFALCYKERCEVIANPQWQIAAFKNAKTDTIWRTSGITIYRLIHENK